MDPSLNGRPGTSSHFSYSSASTEGNKRPGDILSQATSHKRLSTGKSTAQKNGANQSFFDFSPLDQPMNLSTGSSSMLYNEGQSLNLSNFRESEADQGQDDSDCTGLSAADRRKRNCLASARFRQKKKAEMQMLEDISTQKTEECERLTQHVKLLQAEVQYLKQLMFVNALANAQGPALLHAAAAANPAMATQAAQAQSAALAMLSMQALGATQQANHGNCTSSGSASASDPSQAWPGLAAAFSVPGLGATPLPNFNLSDFSGAIPPGISAGLFGSTTHNASQGQKGNAFPTSDSHLGTSSPSTLPPGMYGDGKKP